MHFLQFPIISYLLGRNIHILSYINTNEMHFFFLFGFYNSTCFGRSLRPSSGVLQAVVAATGVCHRCGVE